MRGLLRLRLWFRAKQRENRLNNLLILGAGGYGHVVREIAEDMGIFDKIDFLDDSSPLAIGKFDDAEKFLKDYPNAIVALGNADLRLKYIEKLRAAGFQLPTITSPKSHVSKSAKVAAGGVVEAMAVVNANAALSEGTFVCAGAIVNHNASVGKGCTLQCGSVAPANSTLSDKTALRYNEVYGA